jgi:hypothetical protein
MSDNFTGTTKIGEMCVTANCQTRNGQCNNLSYKFEGSGKHSATFSANDNLGFGVELCTPVSKTGTVVCMGINKHQTNFTVDNGSKFISTTIMPETGNIQTKIGGRSESTSSSTQWHFFHSSGSAQYNIQSKTGFGLQMSFR